MALRWIAKGRSLRTGYGVVAKWPDGRMPNRCCMPCSLVRTPVEARIPIVYHTAVPSEVLSHCTGQRQVREAEVVATRRAGIVADSWHPHVSGFLVLQLERGA